MVAVNPFTKWDVKVYARCDIKRIYYHKTLDYFISSLAQVIHCDFLRTFNDTVPFNAFHIFKVNRSTLSNNAWFTSAERKKKHRLNSRKSVQLIFHSNANKKEETFNLPILHTQCNPYSDVIDLTLIDDDDRPILFDFWILYNSNIYSISIHILYKVYWATTADHIIIRSRFSTISPH